MIRLQAQCPDEGIPQADVFAVHGAGACIHVLDMGIFRRKLRQCLVGVQGRPGIARAQLRLAQHRQKTRILRVVFLDLLEQGQRLLDIPLSKVSASQPQAGPQHLGVVRHGPFGKLLRGLCVSTGRLQRYQGHQDPQVLRVMVQHFLIQRPGTLDIAFHQFQTCQVIPCGRPPRGDRQRPFEGLPCCGSLTGHQFRHSNVDPGRGLVRRCIAQLGSQCARGRVIPRPYIPGQEHDARTVRLRGIRNNLLKFLDARFMLPQPNQAEAQLHPISDHIGLQSYHVAQQFAALCRLPHSEVDSSQETLQLRIIWIKHEQRLQHLSRRAVPAQLKTCLAQ